jgi:cytochrome c peroxidase
LVQKLGGIPEYASVFKNVFTDGVTMLNITRALSSFERTLITASSPFDAYRAGDEKALSPAAVRGMDIFMGERGECFHCHGGFNFTDESLHNDALYVKYKDEGLARITKEPVDAGAFKTPSLRNVALSAPYFHDGSRKNLRDVLKHYNKGGEANPNADPVLKPLGLSQAEIDDVISFLSNLSDKAFLTDPKLARPETP